MVLIHELTLLGRRALELIALRWKRLLPIILLALLIAWPVLARGDTGSAPAKLEQAWQRASAANSFHFETSTQQTTHPTTHPSNIGRRERSEHFDIQGEINRSDDAVTLQLWPNGRTSGNSLTLKQENGRTVGRASEDGEWTEVPEAADLFLQSSTPASYLSAAENVRMISDSESGSLFPSELLPEALDAAVTRYRFDLDGPKYARYMRDMMENELSQRGELPPGVSLGIVQELVEMTGEGELWLDARGLPYRQLVHVEFPAGVNDLEWTEAVISTNYSDWQPRLLDLSALDWRSPQTALTMLGINPTAATQDLIRLTTFSLLLLGLFVLMFGRFSRPARAAVNLLIVAAMLTGPFLQVAGAASFSARQAERGAASAPASAASDSDPGSETAVFQPHRDPLATVKFGAEGTIPDLAAAAPSAAPPAVPVSPQRGAAASACTVGEISDCDGDGLEDKVEIFELGTFVDEVDSDGDGISDNLEVLGFSAGGRTWYLNPRDPDSNKDGLPDGLECSARYNINSDGSINSSITAATCADTDGDGAPDAWDYDNDGDGVPDTVDGDPGSFQKAADNKVNLSLEGYQAGQPLFVDVTVRPTDDEHLWYANNYLDWPDLDQHGQIMRVTPNTLGDDGDMMISAVLEVIIPFDSTNPSRGLPVQDGVNVAGISASDDLSTWLDADTLALYGITANMDADDGAVVLYAPLSMTRDIVGQTPVALSTQLYYEMAEAASDWGADHQMRLLWTVNGYNDQCFPPEGETFASYCDVGSDRSNTTNLSHWTTTKTVLQTYYDDFAVTALGVREEHAVNAAVIAQKQGASGASSHYENYLWHLAETLEETFMGAQLISGQRMTVADISSRYSSWGIPASAIYFDELNVRTSTDLQNQLSGDNVTLRLNEIYSGATKPSKANLLFVGDRTYRAGGLDQSGSAALDLSGEDTITTGFMRWTPYSYDGTTWTNLDLETYLDELGSALTPVFTDGVVTGLGGVSGYDVDDARAGAINLATSFYASLYSGAITLLADGSTVVSTGTLNNGAHTLSGDPVVNITSELLAMARDYYTRISLSNLTLTATLYAEIEAVATSAWAALSESSGLILEALGQVVNGGLSTTNTVALGQLKYAPYIAGNLADLLNAGALDYVFSSTIGTAESYGKGAGGTYSTYIALRGLYKAYSAYKYFTGSVAKVSWYLRDFVETYEVQLYLGYALVVGIAVGSFVYAWASGKITPGSPEFAQKLALEISTIIVATITLLILIVATGGVILGILAVVAVIDALTAIICEAVGVKPGSTVDQWVCGGLTGALRKAITYIIHDYTPLVDLSHSGRLDNSLEPLSISQLTSTPGFVVGNAVNVTADITSTLYFGRPTWMGYAYADTQLIDPNLGRSTFQYQLQSPPADIHLDLGGTDWNFIGDSSSSGGILSGPRFRGNFTAQIAYTVPANEVGVNSGLGIHLAEGFAMQAQDCWLVITGPECFLETWRDTNQVDLSSDIIIDIFPQTIDGFRELALVSQDSYQLAWDTTFPTLVDADNDGVRSKLAGGADPNDSDPDSDGDGLNDGYEQNYGYDNTTADGDNDGLTDYWEAFFRTNPYEADSDGDGLSDSEEAFHPNWVYPYENSSRSNSTPPANAPDQGFYTGGWEIVYEYSGGTPLKTWVSASPTDPDSDDDSIDDLREEVYGYNPLAASTLNVLSLKSQVSAEESGTTYPAPYATLGSSLVYSATVQNELSDRYALGLLQTEYPEDTIRATQEMGILDPLASTSLSGSLSAGSGGLSVSGTTSMTVRGGAIIAAADDNRVLWLRMNDDPATLPTNGSVPIADSTLYQHDANCSIGIQLACPDFSGSYLTFSPAGIGEDSLRIRGGDWLPPADFTMAMWVRVDSLGVINFIKILDNIVIFSQDRSLTVNDRVSTHDTGYDFADGEWTHVAVTNVNATRLLTVYINGQEQWSQQVADLPAGSQGVHLIGEGTNSTQFAMDDLQVFDIALGATEIEQLFGLPVLDIDFDATTADDTPTDDSPSRNTLVCIPGDSCPSTSGTGSYFDQTNFVHAGGDALDFSGDRFTFAAWIYPQTRPHPFDNNAVGAYNSISGALPRTANNNYDWQGVFGRTESSNNLWMQPSLYINPAGQMRMAMGDGSSVCHVDTAEGLVRYDTWQNVTVSYDGSVFSFYINGQKVAESDDSCATITAGAPTILQIGRASELGTLYVKDVAFIEGADSGSNDDYELRVNFDGNGTASNIWSGTASTAKGTTKSIDIAHYIPDDKKHHFRFWDNDTGDVLDYLECAVGCDDNFLYQEVTNTDLGQAAQFFSTTDIEFVDYASGDLYWSISNDFFYGRIGEFKAYKRAFSDEDALKLYETSYDGLYFDFDEPPGAATFIDAYDDNVQATCDYAGGTCPDSGVGGISNQAADFDGSDYLVMSEVNLLNTLDSGFTVAAWIRPDNVSGVKRILAAERDSSANGFGFGLEDDKLLFTTFKVQDYRSSAAVTANEWQHVAVVFDSNFDASFYVNGVYIAKISGTQAANANTDDAYRIGSTTNNGSGVINEAFQGKIDDLTVQDRPLNQAGIQNLMANAPLLMLHLDEDLHTTSFVDDSRLGNDASCSGSACPGAGDKGQIREAAVFDGDDYLTVPASPDLSLKEFTVSLWVNPTEIKNDYQPLLVRENPTSGHRNYGLFIHPDSMDINYSLSNSACSAYEAQTAFNNPLLQHQWNHVVYTFDGSIQRLYINGTLRSSHAYSGTPCLIENAIYIGGKASPYTPLSGSMDELMVHGRAFSTLEIAELFDYQSAWFDVKETHRIVIDHDDPTISLDLANPYLAPGEMVFKIDAADPTSEIASVRYKIDRASYSSGILPATKTNGVWTFSHAFEDEGNYLISLEATDSVGNYGSAYETVYVDTQAPAGIAGSIPLHVPTDGSLAWTNILIDDSAGLDGANSGIDDSTVMVTVRDRLGNIVGAPTPATKMRPGNYLVSIPFTFDPYGEYVFTVSFKDNVGHLGSFEQLVTLESTGPHADVMLHAVTNISAGMTLRGVASDVEHIWQSRGLQLHFEDGAGSTDFLDVSGNEFVAECASSAACPTVQTSGDYNNAVSFDGSNDVLTLTDNDAVTGSTGISGSLEERLGITNSSFTVMAWVNASSMAGFRPLMGTSPFEDDQELFIGFVGGAPAMSYGSGSASSVDTVPAGEWHHVAWRFDMDAREQALFIDGELVNTQPNRDSYNGSGNKVTIGQADPTSLRFAGLVDELVIYNIPVTDERIYDIANPVQSGLDDVKVRFRHIDDQGQLEDSGVWYEATFTSGEYNNIFRTWQLVVPDGLSGSYKIDLKATDHYGVEGLVANSADHLPIPQNERFVPGAWTGGIGNLPIQPNRIFFLPYIALP